MPQNGCDAKGFQDSAVQSATEPHGPGDPATDQDGAAGAKAGPPPAEGDETDRVEIVELTDQLETQLQTVPPDDKPASPYPDFPETNPFRREAPASAAASTQTRAPAVKQRQVSGDGSSGSSLALRRGSDVKVVIPPTPPPIGTVAGAGCSLLVQRAVGDSEPELASAGGGGGGDGGDVRRPGQVERRDSIWDRLPPPEQLEQRRLSDQESGSGAGRLLRSPFPLVQPTPTPDQTNDEGRELFLEFVHDRIVEEGIPQDELALQAQSDDTINRIMSLPGLSNPVWAQTGTELRALADAFATSHQRRELRCKAQQTDLTAISWDRFRQLLEELFSGEAGVTQERILVLFFFLSDCVVSTIRRHAWAHLRRLIEWSLRYIVERVCALVQEAGGWGVVLRQSAEYLYLGLKIAATSLICIAAIIYIRKN